MFVGTVAEVNILNFKRTEFVKGLSKLHMWFTIQNQNLQLKIKIYNSKSNPVFVLFA